MRNGVGRSNAGPNLQIALGAALVVLGVIVALGGEDSSGSWLRAERFRWPSA